MRFNYHAQREDLYQAIGAIELPEPLVAYRGTCTSFGTDRLIVGIPAEEGIKVIASMELPGWNGFGACSSPEESGKTLYKSDEIPWDAFRRKALELLDDVVSAYWNRPIWEIGTELDSAPFSRPLFGYFTSGKKEVMRRLSPLGEIGRERHEPHKTAAFEAAFAELRQEPFVQECLDVRFGEDMPFAEW